MTHANGSIFNGSYDNDVACGEATFLYPGGHTEVKGTWLQGQLHGEVRLSHVFLPALVAASSNLRFSLDFSDAVICHDPCARDPLQVIVINNGQHEKQLWSMGKKIVQGDM